MGSLKNCPPIRFSRLASYSQQLYKYTNIYSYNLLNINLLFTKIGYCRTLCFMLDILQQHIYEQRKLLLIISYGLV